MSDGAEHHRDPAASWRFGPVHSLAVFRALLDSIARPGRVITPDHVERIARRCPQPAWWPVLCLADHGIQVAAPGASDLDRTALGRATGCRTVAEVADADLVVVSTRGRSAASADLGRMRRGSAEAPELGARLIVAVADLAAEPAEPHASSDSATSDRVLLRISGPGAAAGRLVAVDGVDPGLVDALSRLNATPPAGVDTWLVDGGGRFVALPRSSRVEALERSLAGSD